MLRNRSLCSFVVAGWARQNYNRFRRTCEILADRSVNHQEFLATMLEDGIRIPVDLLDRFLQTSRRHQTIRLYLRALELPAQLS